MDYARTLSRVEDYFDRTATQTWERLTSDAPVSKVRQTVRAGRDRMRALMQAQLPRDLHGLRILDAGCGTGTMSLELAARGAEVMGIDIAPNLIEIAKDRVRAENCTFLSGDMLAPELGSFDHVVAMDSLIYYTPDDLTAALEALAPRVRGSIVFTLAPRTPFLMTFWYAGKVFPRSDRSPTMVPQNVERLARDIPGLRVVDRVASGFYTSTCMEWRP